jgi:hypothetical protein
LLRNPHPKEVKELLVHDQQSTPQESSRAKKLLQAAAFAAALVPLGSVAAEAGMIDPVDINCTPLDPGSCNAGFYSFSGAQTHTWGFFADPGDLNSTLYYTLTIAVSLPQFVEFNLKVDDAKEPFGPLQAGPAQPTSSVCIPNLDPTLDPPLNAANCVTFAVGLTLVGDSPAFNGAFDITIAWLDNAHPLSGSPPLHLLDHTNTDIFRAGSNGYYSTSLDAEMGGSGTNYTNTSPEHFLAGRSSTLGKFVAMTSVDPVAPVPEPATFLLVGAGMLVIFVATKFAL